MRSRLRVYRPEAVNVLGLIRTQTRQGSLVDLHPVGHERLQPFRHRHYIVKDEQVRDQMVVLDHFALFIARVFRQEAATAERDPLHEQVEHLAFVRRRLIVRRSSTSDM